MGSLTGRLKFRLPTGLLAMVLLLTVGSAAPADAATEADTLAAEGRIVEPAPDAALDLAIDRVNAEGVAFVWLDDDGDDLDAISLADDYVDQLEQMDSRYRTVLVVLGGGYGASSNAIDADRLNGALDAAFAGFSSGAMDRGLDGFTESLTGAVAATTATTSTSETSASDSPGSTDGDSGFGFGSFLLALLVAGGGFVLVRGLLNRRKAKRQAELDLAEDRAEIKEQLENNADRVITLGDRVIARGDRELIDLYEQASAAYQDVSQRIEGAASAAEVDELDDRIDRAEWQFEVIEAELEGRPRPPEPVPESEAPGPGMPPPPLPGGSDGAAVPPPPDGAEPPVVTSPRTGRTYPRSTSRRSTSGGRSGGLGGGLGGLGGILANIVFGGGLGGLGGSRRTQRRSGASGGGLGGSGLGRSSGSRTGSLGGGVLRRGGSSSRSSRKRRRSSGGRRSAGRSRSRGGRSFGRSRSRGGRKL